MKKPITHDDILKMLCKAKVSRRSNIPQAPETKTLAFFEEFPFLKELVPTGCDHNGVTMLFVSRLVSSVIERMVHHAPSHYHREHVWLLDREGAVVEHAVPVEYKRKKYLVWGKMITIKGTKIVSGKMETDQSIADLLDTLGESAAKVYYAVSYHEYTGAVIVYKKLPEIELVGYGARLKAEEQREFDEKVEEVRRDIRAQFE
ncbi:MAG: hypothetical protein WC761_06100 [Candidatus Paceibacterota bacterium]|jgi:hypothetical protein